MSIIQQLEDLKEWSKDSRRYERRLAFRGNMGTEAGTIPIEWDELSDREVEYYRTGPWSTREEYRKGQLVQPGPGRQGYQGKKTKFIRSALDENELKILQTYGEQLEIPNAKNFTELDFKIYLDKKHKGKSKFTQIKSDIKKGNITLDTLAGSKVMSKDRVKQLKWIANNSQRFVDPNKLIDAFKSHFKIKNIANAALFSEASLGGGAQGERRKFTLNALEKNKNKITSHGSKRNFFTFKPNYSEAELFKAAIIQNNPQAKINLKKTFDLIEKDFKAMKVMMSEKGFATATMEEALEAKLNAKYKYLKQFDFLPGTAEEPGLLGRGIVDTSLEKNGITREALGMYQALSWNNSYMDNIIRGLETRPETWGPMFGLDKSNIGKVVNGWKEVSEGKKAASAWVNEMDNLIGEGKFNKIFGNVIFEHKVAKKFGKEWRYFPRDYLLQGQFANQAFNNAKFVSFDKPMIKLIQKYENTTGPAKGRIADQMKRLLKDFNRVSGGYMKNYDFDFSKGFKFVDKAPRKEFANVSRYVDDSKLAAKEMSQIATKAFDVSKLEGTKFRSEQMKAIKKYSGKQDDLTKIFQKAKIGGHCKAYGGRVGFEEAGAVNMSKCMTKAIEDNKKAMNSTDESVRAAAIFKNRQAVNNAKKIPAIAKLIRQGIQKGKSSVGWLLGGWNIPLEAIVEGGIYEYYRREGYTHDQAFAETFTPRLIKEGAEARSTEKVPWYGGAEELLEEELYKIKGENEFLDVDNRPPMQDPEFGQVIGEREGVKRYIDNMAALDEVTSEYYKTQDHLAAAQSGRVKIDPDTIARLQIRLKELEAEGIRLNRLIKEGSSDWQLHQTQLEKQQTEQGQRAIEYGEYGQGDTEALAKRREKIRQREMEDKFPGYGKAYIDKELGYQGMTLDPNIAKYKKDLELVPGTYDEVSDYWKDYGKTAYFADNFRTEKAGGGIAGVRRPNAIPPVSGPMPQGGGLSTMFNRVKPW